MPVNPDLLERARAVLSKHPDYGRYQLASEIGCGERVARDILSTLRANPPQPDKPTPALSRSTMAESISETAESLSYELPSTRIHTLEQLVEYFKVDLTVWEVDRFVCNKWEVGSKDADGNPRVTPLYQVKASFKRNHNVEFAAKRIEEMAEDAKKNIRPQFPVIIRKRGEKSGVMAEISIADLHAAKLSHHEETGEDYDLKIATKRFNDALAYIANDIAHREPESICLVLGNDLFQADNPESMTYRGTRVDVDSRYHKAFREVLTMTRDGIEYLRQMAPVTVKMVPGNHDTQSVFHLGVALDCWFHTCPDVMIDNAPTMRKYVEWGTNMLMLTHGDKGRAKNFPLLMATEQPEMFGRTKVREVHLGHWHKVGAEETNGVVVRILPSLCAADAWHSSMGFVGNIKRAEAYLFHREKGLMGTSIYSVLDAGRKLK